MGLIAKIFGGSKNAETIIEKGVEFIDKAFYTDEEKAKNKVKLLDFYLKWQETTKGQNLARRIIAISIVILYMFLILLAVIAYLFNPLWSVMIFGTLKDTLMQPFNIIIAFYFANALIRDYRNNKK